MSEPAGRLTILGCGSSGGVPRADGDWGVCDPNEPRNRRTRCSVLIQRLGPDGATNVLVDTAPEMRQQLAATGIRHLDGVVFTHDHADQTHGIDDVRAFFQRTGRAVDAWMDTATHESLMRRFGYCFTGAAAAGYPAILKDHVLAQVLPADLVIHGAGGPLRLQLLDQDHGTIRSLGIRCGDLAYCNDVVALPPQTLACLSGLNTLIVDALRQRPHPTHAHLALALDWIHALKPEQAVLTNMHIDLDYQTLIRSLPAGVVPAHDGLTLAFDPG